MSNISRRQFLKSAGVAALAVAALTGCKKIPDTDIPDVPEVTSVALRVLFVDEKGNPVGDGVTGHYDTTVLKHKDVVTSTKYVKVTFQNCDTGKIVEKQIKVAEDAKKIYAKDLTLPEGWALADGNENWSSDLKLGEGADAGLDVAILPCLCKNA